MLLTGAILIPAAVDFLDFLPGTLNRQIKLSMPYFSGFCGKGASCTRDR
jgi:hypothetical protein